MTLASLHAEDWPAISALLDEALALPPAQRDAWLGALNGERAAWRERLRALLAHASSVETDDFLGTLPPLRMAGDRLEIGGAQPGAEVGPYRLIEELGAGGMGAVWLAERADGSLRRKVALKLPRMGWDPAFAQRSARERDILAALEHPNIARLYDAGADALGRPYLAMEYVEGEPIDVYCDHHALPLAARVGLLLQVAEAVAYAHRRLVVHRDLKPSNILVNGAAQVRLLDFGIARLLADDGSPSAEATLAAPALTINYASPEQLQGQPLSTATDVYSLGVVAHELLCGVRPFDHLAARGLDRVPAILAAEPALPSSRLRDGEHAAEHAAARGASPAALRRQLRGDLDAILLRALARRPEDRYPSVEALADDLARWRDGRPVAAQRPHAGYLLRKFIGRHRLAVAAGSAAAVALAATAAVAVVQGMQAREQAQRAQASRDFLVGLFERANPDLRGGRDATARELLEQGETDLARLPAEQQHEIRAIVAGLWVNFGDLQRAAAAQAQLSEQLAAVGGVALAQSRIEQGRLAVLSGQPADAERFLRQAEEAAQVSRWPLRTRGAADYAWGIIEIGRSEFMLAVARLGEALNAAQASGDAVLEARALGQLLQAHLALGQVQQALERQRALAALLAGGRIAEPRRQQEAFAAMVRTLEALGRWAECWPVAERLVAGADTLFGPQLAAQMPHRLLWLRCGRAMGRAAELAAWLAANDADTARLAVYPAFRQLDWYRSAARIWAEAGDATRAERDLQRAREQLDRLPADRRELWRGYLDLSEALVALALGDAGRAWRLMEPQTRDPQVPARLRLHAEWCAGVALTRLKRPGEAGVLLRRAEAGFAAAGERELTSTAQLRLNLALLALADEAPPDAAALRGHVRFAAAALPGIFGAAHPTTRLALGLQAALPPDDVPLAAAAITALRQAAGAPLQQLVLY